MITGVWICMYWPIPWFVLDAGLATSTCLTTSTRSSPPRRGTCHVDAGLVTWTSGSGPRRGTCHVDAELRTSTRGLPRRYAAHHLDAGFLTSILTQASPL
ncbi:hypothetical protein K438DRAFT_18446 [Mycena galopus ATCC 62051]|nr:hypothetical protein K438DRAFT_18446 [Mycena galopus ATCC 62051]